MSFQIGDRVRWQARTGDPEREGTVAHVIPSLKPPFDITPISFFSYKNRKHHIHFDPLGIRDHETYIILTDPGKRGGKPSAFRPLVKNLKLVEPKDTKQ